MCDSAVKKGTQVGTSCLFSAHEHRDWNLHRDAHRHAQQHVCRLVPGRVPDDAERVDGAVPWRLPDPMAGAMGWSVHVGAADLGTALGTAVLGAAALGPVHVGDPSRSPLGRQLELLEPVQPLLQRTRTRTRVSGILSVPRYDVCFSSEIFLVLKLPMCHFEVIPQKAAAVQSSSMIQLTQLIPFQASFTENPTD